MLIKASFDSLKLNFETVQELMDFCQTLVKKSVSKSKLETPKVIVKGYHHREDEQRAEKLNSEGVKPSRIGKLLNTRRTGAEVSSKLWRLKNAKPKVSKDQEY